MVTPQSISGLALLVDLEFFEELECLFLGVASDLGSDLVLHPLVSVTVLHLLILLRELELLEAVDLIFNVIVGGGVNSPELLVGLRTDHSAVQDIVSLNLEDLPLVALLTNRSKHIINIYGKFTLSSRALAP